jgi:uncharacterized protein with PIN domain
MICPNCGKTLSPSEHEIIEDETPDGVLIERAQWVCKSCFTFVRDWMDEYEPPAE